jgi:hypothetical protein
MAKWISGATCAAVVLTATLAAAQTTTPKATSQSAQRQSSKPAKAPQVATLTGCVVRDAVNGGQATIASNGISYKLTGRPDKDFEQYLGKRVEVTGALTTGSTGARATTGKSGIGASGAPKEQTATAGQSDITATGTPRDNTVPSSAETVPLATDRGTTADLTGRMEVKTLRMISPSCL